MKIRGIPKDCVYQEKVSGKDMNREELQKLLRIVRRGDRIVITEISRLGRNMRDIINVIYDLEKRGIDIYSIKENVDTSTELGKVFFNIAGVFAEIERNAIRERQKQGIAIAKRKGNMTGRPKLKIEDFEQRYKQYKNGELSVSDTVKLLGCSRATFYRRKKDFEEKQVLQEMEKQQKPEIMELEEDF